MTKTGAERPEHLVLDFMRRHSMAAGRKLLVAVSGGPDSVCLLHVLFTLRLELQLELHVAHLNHQLRGADSDEDAHYVAALAAGLGIPATIESRDVKKHRSLRRLSLEEAARQVRYGFLAATACKIGAERVAVGHTRDDHIETILLHLLRGAGTRGMRGLEPVARVRGEAESVTIVRPLLPLSRRDTVDYCRSHDLEPRQDVSNLSLSPLRNRIRLELLPLLRGYNPAIDEALLRAARIARDDTTFLENTARAAAREIITGEPGGISLDRQKLRSLDIALQRQVLRLAIERLLGELKDIEARHIEEILEALPKPAGKRLDLPFGLRFINEYERYRILKGSAELCDLPELASEVKLNIPGETSLPGWLVRADFVEARPPFEPPDDYTAYLDADSCGPGLVVRPRQPGDRFQPLGLPGLKKLNEFMIDARIPAACRGRVPIIALPDRIVWVVGWRIDERARVKDSARRALRLVFSRV